MRQLTLEQQLQKMKYTITEAREDLGIKIKDLNQHGISRSTYESAIYGTHSPSIMTFMKICDHLGLEVVIRKKGGGDDGA